MKLKTKILSLSLIPLILLGTIMFLVAADRIANGIYDEAYLGMHATTLAIRDIFEMGYEGDYHLDEQGELWKGDELNISQSLDIVDHIKENTGLDVTIFWEDTRILTSLADENGERQVGTKASSKIADMVLNQGKSYQNRHVDILGSEYVVYYEPFCQIGTDDVVGMIFLGTPQASVSNIINKVRLQLFLIIVAAVILSVIVIYTIANKIVVLLNKNMGLLETVSSGNLNIVVENHILTRRDEIGDLGRSIKSLKIKLGQIVHNISEKSESVLEESDVLKETTETVNQVMKELDHAAQSISESSTHQTEDIAKTNQKVKDVNDGVGKMVHGMQEIMAESRKLEEIRTDTIAIVQNSASASEENLASVEEIMAGITKVYADIEKISENVKMLNVHSVEMKERIKVFSM